ncbi:Isoleucine--tRNA ligase [uncultured archaeon]|nr:Isoleucine--tRNA ligase [uncultured archaeon]
MREKGEKFYFKDGPPYATRQIHPGTAWNKCVKDAVCRYKRMKGFSVRAQPGFDTHGLPIEVKVEQELKFKSKKDIEKFGVEKFIEKCKSFATQYIGVMTGQFKSLGVWMDWDDPYLTYKDGFIEKSWRTIKKAQEKKLLLRGVYVLPECPRCETTVANYELEYGEQSDPSVYLKFKVKGEKDTFLIVWTTTPWTIPGNLAVMAHPDYTYVKAKANKEKWILAKDRLAAVTAIADPLGLKLKVEAEFSGRKIEGLEYEHPLASEVPAQGKEFAKFHKVILNADFVTLEEGTGLVHTAPGHGPQDFEAGKKAGIPPFCPVNAAGKYTEEAGAYAGLGVFEANAKIVEDLRAKGGVLNAGKITHRYPHCWRCKSPLIFMVTDQWFVEVSKMREKMLSEIDTCKWQPDHARVWFRDFVSNAPDWCISRQRYWGIPLPIWLCQEKGCKEMAVIGSRKELEHLSGEKPAELHKPQLDKITIECKKCGGKMKRVPDVLDVWFDSGNAIWASLSDKEEKEWYPADFIVEGKDQIRGWFYSLLGSGVVANDEIPYKSLLMHGHFVDEKGEKMSKSLGNFVPLEEVVGKYGADTFRLWSLNSVVWDDLKFNWDEIGDANRSLGIFWNLHIFLSRTMEAEGFDPKAAEKEKFDYDLEDQWLISRLNSTILQATKAMDAYAVHEANRAVRQFIVSDLSRLYLKLAKKRLNDERNGRALMKLLYDSLLAATKLSTPFTPFLAEEIYQNSFRKFEGAESVSLLAWPSHDPGAINQPLEKQMGIAVEIASAAASARQAAGVNLRWPVEEVVVATVSTEVHDAAERLPFIIEMLANVKSVKLAEKSPSALSFRVNKNRVGAAFKQRSQKVIACLEAIPAEELRDRLAEGKLDLEVDNYKLPIVPDMVEFMETPPAGYALAPGPESKILVKTEIAGALYAEGLRREVARRIQLMRKEAGLVEKDEIEATVSASKEFLSVLESQAKELPREVNAAKTSFVQSGGKAGKKPDMAKVWEIEGEKVTIQLCVKR